MAKIRSRVKTIFAVAYLIGSASCLAMGPDLVTLTMLPIRDEDVRKKFWNRLLATSKPVTLKIEASQEVVKAIQIQCGSAPPDLIEVAKNLNPGLNLSSDSNSREIRFIPCPYWVFSQDHRPLKISVKEGQTLQDVLPLYMGTAGEQTLKNVLTKNPGKFDPYGKALKKTNITIPYLTKGVSFVVNPDSNWDASDLIASMANAFPSSFPSSLLNANVQNNIDQFKLVAEDGLALSNIEGSRDCHVPDTGAVWPYDIEKINNIYAAVKAKLIGNLPTATILVADTGLSLEGLSIADGLWRNFDLVNGHDSTTGFYNDWNGADMVRGGGDISPTSGYAFSLHGTNVVRIALGGDRLATPFAGSFKVAIAKITRAEAPYGISPQGVGAAFNYGNSVRADVLNLSIVVGSFVPILKNGLQGTQFLVVVAAGNNDARPEDKGIYPAAVTDFRERVIVVGAHDWSKRKASFSNYGGLVDLLAHGCGIPISQSNAPALLVSGTSFAAPFVSLTAALLRSLGLNAIQAKTRILATADYDSNLVGIVNSAGTLNIENAISIDQDILIIRDAANPLGTVLKGQLDPIQVWGCVGTNTTLAPHTVVRIVPSFGSPEELPKARIWKKMADGTPVQDTCRSIGGLISFRKSSDPAGVFSKLEWANVISLIPRHH